VALMGKNEEQLKKSSRSFNIANILRVVEATFFQHWKTSIQSSTNIAQFLGGVPGAAVFAWFGSRSGDPAIYSYIMVGGTLLVIWNAGSVMMNFSLSSEMWNSTMDFIMISRTPVMFTLYGQGFAQVIQSIPIGMFAFLAMFIVTRHTLVIASIPFLLISLAFLFLSMIVTGLLQAPIYTLSGARGGAFNFMGPLAIMLSGFLFPVDQLPKGLEIIARLFPSSWAMTSVWQSIGGTSSFGAVAQSWVFCILTATLLTAVTYILFKVVEKRLRVTGTMGLH
jgi:ABC-2 type transport system permease protein